MKLQLNHVQRLNLWTLAGEQPAGSVSNMRAAWALLDKLDLTPTEAGAIEMKTAQVNGNEARVWNPSAPPLVVEMEFGDAEVKRLKELLKWACSSVLRPNARQWVEPLLMSLGMEE